MLLRLGLVILSGMLAGSVMAQSRAAKTKPAPDKTVPAKKTPLPAAKAPALQQLKIAFKKNGECILEAVGLGTFGCLGQSGVAYPKEFYISSDDKKGTHYSQEYKVEMPYAVLLWGQKGIYLHEGKASLRANHRQPSRGCIRLAKPSAQKVYKWLAGLTKVTIAYPWTPVATQAKAATPTKPSRPTVKGKAVKSLAAGVVPSKTKTPATPKAGVTKPTKAKTVANTAASAPKVAVRKAAPKPVPPAAGARTRTGTVTKASAKSTVAPKKKNGNPGWMF